MPISNPSCLVFLKQWIEIMKKIFISGLISMTALLQGCASVEDFKKMTPDQRATKVCDSDIKTRSLENSIRRQQQIENDAENTLRRGYYIVEHCDYRYVKEPKRKNSHLLEKDDKKKKEKPKKEYVCEKQLIPLTQYGAMQLVKDVDAAKDKYNALSAELREHYYGCQLEVRSLSPEEAFKRY